MVNAAVWLNDPAWKSTLACYCFLILLFAPGGSQVVRESGSQAVRESGSQGVEERLLVLLGGAKELSSLLQPHE